jgi:hypothetical protein
MQVEIDSGLNSGNVCYHSVQILLSSRLLSRNVKDKIYETIILPVALYGSLTLREENRRRVSENRVVREYFDLRRMKQENGESCTMRSFIFCTPPQILLGESNQGE